MPSAGSQPVQDPIRITGKPHVCSRALCADKIEQPAFARNVTRASQLAWFLIFGQRLEIYSENNQEMPYFRSLTFSSIAADGHRTPFAITPYLLICAELGARSSVLQGGGN